MNEKPFSSPYTPMNEPIRSPKAQEVKAVKGFVKIRDVSTGILEVYSDRSKCEWSCENDHHCEGIQEIEIRPVPHDNQPPLAEKSLLNPNPHSCQSDGNREKEALEWLSKSGLYLHKNCEGQYSLSVVQRSIVTTYGGKDALEIIQSAMSQQEKKI